MRYEVSLGGEVLITIMQTVYFKVILEKFICQLCELFALTRARMHHLTYLPHPDTIMFK